MPVCKIYTHNICIILKLSDKLSFWINVALLMHLRAISMVTGTVRKKKWITNWIQKRGSSKQVAPNKTLRLWCTFKTCKSDRTHVPRCKWTVTLGSSPISKLCCFCMSLITIYQTAIWNQGATVTNIYSNLTMADYWLLTSSFPLQPSRVAFQTCYFHLAHIIWFSASHKSSGFLRSSRKRAAESMPVCCMFNWTDDVLWDASRETWFQLEPEEKQEAHSRVYTLMP